MKERVEFVIIDPQNSFCQKNGELYVPGADEDEERLARCIFQNIDRISDIHITLDSHRELDVAHPLFWKNKKGKHPDFFQIITYEDVKNKTFIPFNPNLEVPKPYNNLYNRMLAYTKQLEENNRYALCIWPPHTLIGTYGHNVIPVLSDVLREWERKHYGMVDYVIKGANPFTEHYSAVLADVPDDNDPNTLLNTSLITTIQKADKIVFSGQALSHCLKFTMRDIISNFGSDIVKKCILLIDTTSSVTGYEQTGIDFIEEIKKQGVQIIKSTDLIL